LPGVASQSGNTYDSSIHIGRFPANLVLSHNPDCWIDIVEGKEVYTCTPGCAIADLDRQSGEGRAGKPSGTGKLGKAKGNAESIFGNDGAVTARYDDINVSGASRF